MAPLKRIGGRGSVALAAGLFALNVALIPRFGLSGAMWATTASYAIGLAASWALGRRVMPLPVPWCCAG